MYKNLGRSSYKINGVTYTRIIKLDTEKNISVTLTLIGYYMRSTDDKIKAAAIMQEKDYE